MALYRCDACNEDRDDPICEKCGRETRELESGEADFNPPRDIAPPPSMPIADGGLKPASPPPPPPPAPAVPGRTVSEDDEGKRRLGSPQSRIRGLDEFEALLDRKTSAIVICGDSRTGKSEIVHGFLRARNIYRGEAQIMTLRAPDRSQRVLGGTVAGEVWYQVIDDRLAFLDPSGEFFKQLSPEERRRLGLPDVTEEQFQFVRKAVAHLAGIVLVVDLTRTLGPDDFSAWKRQEDDLNFVLAALRWLRWDNTARPPQIGVSVNIAKRVSKLRRIDKPVLVLFSKADQLTQYTNTSPLELAQRSLPTLHGALMTHARRFRYDFCHTMIQTAQGDTAVERPCGVLLSMEWLLREPFRWLPFQLPTKSALLGGGK